MSCQAYTKRIHGLTCSSSDAGELHQAGRFRAVEGFEEFAEDAEVAMSEEEGDDGLSKEIRDGAVKHPAQRADTVMELQNQQSSSWSDAYHSLKISLASTDEIALEGAGMRVTQADRIAIVRPDWLSASVPEQRLTVVENGLDIRCRRIREQTQLGQHRRQYSTRERRLNDIRTIETVNAA